MAEQVTSPLSFKSLVKGFIKSVKLNSDSRKRDQTKYEILDSLLSGLAAVFYKCAGMADFQRRMEKHYHRNNLQTHFNVVSTPKDNQMRAILGEVKPEEIEPVFSDYLSKMQRSNRLKLYKIFDRYLLTLDGTEYYSSKKIHCDQCLQTEKNGMMTYSHKVVQPIISHPDKKQILPLMPEEICQQDGEDKQDCETNSAKRLVDKIRKSHPRMRFIYMGDALYANTPYIEKIREKDDKFIFRVKNGSHKYLFKYFDEAEQSGTEETDVKAGKRYVYKYALNIPLFKDSKILVNVMRLFIVTTDKQTGKQKSSLIGTWATHMPVNDDNISEMVKCARARWKIENEGFNSLKNDGYNITHSWGHVNGEAFNVYLLTLLAFYMHQILELGDKLYQKCRVLAKVAYTLWEELRVLFNRFLYESWEALLKSYLKVHTQGTGPPLI